MEFLKPKDLVLILDNCEHLLDEVCELATRILAGSPGAWILATSREGVAIAGERLWPLRPSPIPAANANDSAVSEAPSVQLFVLRAQAVSPDFRLGPDNAAAVAEVCRRLDGIPLAIELAASRRVALAPQEIVQHLDERFRLLTGGTRGAVERHQTLRATVDWSYSLLSPMERSAFSALAVFAGSFDATAAQAVLADQHIATWEMTEALIGLVTKSMLTADRVASTTRYRLPETLRQYGLEQLGHAGKLDATRRSMQRATPSSARPSPRGWPDAMSSPGSCASATTRTTCGPP